jgi:hypothetical protein
VVVDEIVHTDVLHARLGLGGHGLRGGQCKTKLLHRTRRPTHAPLHLTSQEHRHAQEGAGS